VAAAAAVIPTMKESAIRALAHEIGHALTNRLDVYFTRYVFFPRAPMPLQPDTDTRTMRRLLHEYEGFARTERDPECLVCSGNLYFAPSASEGGQRR